jgi:DNA-directed RNA polymerase II subunit RPB2
MIYTQEDMPFTQDGIVPDIIINPHAIPSRMTIGQIMECILGKACVFNGNQFGDSTPFTDLKVEDISSILEEHNVERYGNEVLYNPITGEQIKTSIFIGPTYYQRLKHMVSDKIHSRSSNGPIVLLTRQPFNVGLNNGIILLIMIIKKCC